MTQQIKERPIIFSGEMVRAILDGRKTQTRRIVKPQPDFSGKTWIVKPDAPNLTRENILDDCPYGKPMDRLWVRETFCLENTYEYHSDVDAPSDRPFQIRGAVDGGEYFIIPHYRADGPFEFMGDDGEPKERWKPSIHMPRWASRVLLEITAVRVERLQDISEGDALDEGIHVTKIGSGYTDKYAPGPVSWSSVIEQRNRVYETAYKAFQALWESINGPGAWDKNPWVWVIEFKQVQQ